MRGFLSQLPSSSYRQGKARQRVARPRACSAGALAPSWGGARLLLAAIEPVSPALPPFPRPLSLQWHSKR